MFKQVYQSEPMRYLLPEELMGTLFGGFLYNDWLLDPPRIYAETIGGSGFTGLWVIPETSFTGQGTISLGTWHSQIRWPGWSIKRHRWDAASGKYLGYDYGLPGGYYSNRTYQMPDDTVWTQTVLGEIYELSLSNTDLGWLDPKPVIPWSAYGEPGWSPGPFLINRRVNRAITETQSTNNRISIRHFDTGNVITTLNVNGFPEQIIGVDDRRAYVFCRNGLLTLIDYNQGKVLGVTRAPNYNAGDVSGVGEIVFTYDRIFNRLMSCQHTADAEDGACTIVVKGYYPLPLPTGMSKPIPLKPLRKDRESPVLVRMWGDAAEPVGATVKGSITGDAELLQSVAATDGMGDAFLKVRGLQEGSTVITAESTVPPTVDIVNDPADYHQ